MALQAYHIMKQRKRQFRVSEELQAMRVSVIESAAAIAGAWQSPPICYRARNLKVGLVAAYL